MREILPLEGTIQEYTWGSRTTLGRMLGRAASAQPQAELWLGDHPKSPSTAITGSHRMPLDRLIATYPAPMLGKAEPFGALPYLLKVLAIEKPLSLQLHPTAAQARAGYEREQRAGLPANAPNRSYRDRNHKPELLVAVEPTTVMSGVRPREQIATAVSGLDLPPPLQPLMRLVNANDQPALRHVVRWLLQLSSETGARLHDQLCHQVDAATVEGALLQQLAAAYPADPTILAALLLNSVELQPGEAIYTGAGTLHAYVHGAGVELMANSDNVLRAGLTPKHVDVHELLAVVALRPVPLRPLGGVVENGERSYPTPAREFLLSVLELHAGGKGGLEFHTHDGPELLLLLGSSASLGWHGDSGTPRSLQLSRGNAAFVPAIIGRYTATGSGALYRARLPAATL